MVVAWRVVARAQASHEADCVEYSEHAWLRSARKARYLLRMSRKPGRKLLVASVGVATVSYVLACTDQHRQRTGNLVAPEPSEEPQVGNLVPPPEPDAGDPPETTDTGGSPLDAGKLDAGKIHVPTRHQPIEPPVGNLMPPPLPPPPPPKRK